jgi:hypothetical protein
MIICSLFWYYLEECIYFSACGACSFCSFLCVMWGVYALLEMVVFVHSAKLEWNKYKPLISWKSNLSCVKIENFYSVVYLILILSFFFASFSFLLYMWSFFPTYLFFLTSLSLTPFRLCCIYILLFIFAVFITSIHNRFFSSSSNLSLSSHEICPDRENEIGVVESVIWSHSK